MPDAVLKLSLKDHLSAELEKHLSHLSWRGLDLSPALNKLGESMLETFRESFARQASPSGDPWPDLSPRTKQNYVSRGKRRKSSRRRRGSGHILQAAQQPGWLLTSLREYVSTHDVAVGEHIGPVGYRAEFGDPQINDPPRPFIELTDKMEEEAAKLILDYLEKKF